MDIFKDFLEAISPALQALLVGLVNLLLVQASLFVSAKINAAKVGLSADKQYILELVVENAVTTVEQIYYSADNMTKKNEAIAIAENALKQYNLKIDLDVIADLIEAKVFQHKNTPQG